MLCNFTIRKLNSNDSTEFFSFRLTALQASPLNFLSSYEEEKYQGINLFHNQLSIENESNVIFGAFINEKLIGSAGLFQENKQKLMHRCNIWGMHVDSNYRQRGIGKALIETTIQYAKKQLKCQIINLTVTATNLSAIKLYESYGFKTWGIEPKAMQVDSIFYDELHMSLIIEN